ncbi:hypothetical protein [Fodinibius salsisoli]|uniref:NIPSNAP protein n=1 Tax=Fodinibius salsisoli TaxID=2820877 RepID=A0ABT3PRD8_9BACT|nr:hypothetical protein [Fodinibius salsisoli]MCW9708428.1 hypothetical protein [Fodinibius salsisoli]
MKTFTLLLVLLTITTTAAFSQNGQDTYKKFDYIRVDKEQLSTFMNLVKENLASAYQKLADNGEIKDWTLYHAEYPGGEENHYNFVSIVTASDLASFENIFSSVTSIDYFPPEAQSENMPTVENSVVKTELWKLENAIMDSTGDTPSKYMIMDYMKVTPGKNPDYLMLEEEVAKPIHEGRIDKEKMNSWQVYSLLTPGGTEYGYNFATGNYYEKLEHLEYGFNDAIINQSMGTNVNIPELFNTIYSTRDHVKSELWRLVAHTE